MNIAVEDKIIRLTGDVRSEWERFCELKFRVLDRYTVVLDNTLENRVALGIEQPEAPKPAPVVDDTGFAFKTKPFEHQLKIWKETKDETYWAYLMEQGTGKSKLAIDVAAHLFIHGDIDCVVVVAPNNVHANWIRNEFPAHCPCRWTGSTYYAGDGLVAAEDKQTGGLLVYAFNVEGFVSKLARELITKILRSHRCLLIVDESSRIKNFKALRTKFVLGLRDLAAYRRILSGTPITQGAEDLWSQFEFLSPSILRCRTYYAFRARYCRMGGFKNKKIVGYYNMDELQDRIGKHSTRVLKSECLDLPAKVYQTLPFRLSPATQKLYTAVRKEALADLMQMLGGEKAMNNIAEMAMVRILRLQQITSGLSPDSDMHPLPGDNSRLDALEGILEDLPGKAIIFARFKSDVENVCNVLPKGSFVTLTGATKTQDRIEAVRLFQEDPAIKYFVGNPAAAGIGITLTAAETVIYYSQDTNLEYRLQSEDRAHRIGQTKTVTYIDIVAEGTVDEKNLKALRAKKTLAQMILDDPMEVFA